MTLPEIIGLFPLPNVVLFPRIALPLHVFEPRYRALVASAIRGPRLIGMALLRGDWQATYYARPELFPTGTVGEIVHTEELEDGRYNIVLRGLREFEIVEELPARALFREVRVRWRADPEELRAGLREAVIDRVGRYLVRLGHAVPPEHLRNDVGGEALVNFFAQHLDLDPLEKQALLEERTTQGRAERLIDVLEFRLQALAGPAGRQARPQ